MLREEPEDWVEEDTWEEPDRNSETPAPGSDDDYFHIDSMEEFQNALEEKNSEKVVFTKTVNQLIEKVENEQQQRLQNVKKQVDKSFWNVNSKLQQIQEAISKSISSDTLLQELAQEFDKLYEKCLSSETIINHYEETLESNASVEKKTDTFKQIIAEHKALSWTACYNNSCYTHMLNKNATEYYSKKSRKPRNQVVWEAQEISKSEWSALTRQNATMEPLDWEISEDKCKMRKDQTLW